MQSGYAGEEELKTAQSEQREAVMAGNRYSIKKTQNSVLLAKRMLALASKGGVEQIQGRKPMETKMSEDDRQGPHINGRNLNKCNTIITMRSKQTKGGKNSSPPVKWG